MEALKEELDTHHDLTWETSNPQELERVKAEFPEAHIARVFPVHGIKNAEDANKENHKWRVRAVFGGNHIRTTTGLPAVFQEIQLTPSKMVAARVLIFQLSEISASSRSSLAVDVLLRNQRSNCDHRALRHEEDMSRSEACADTLRTGAAA